MARALLEDDESSVSNSEEGPSSNDVQLNVNQAFARRFEHNKKREELQRLEEKYGKSNGKRKRSEEDGAVDDTSSASSSDSEDDEFGELATEALDFEITATLNAIRSKDPRVYDGKTSFYTSTDQDQNTASSTAGEKPMFLRDYHRQNLLNGVPVEEENQRSYNQEQADLKKEIVGAMHAAAESDSGSDGEDGLLVAKVRQRPEPQAVLDVNNADRDPETFLSNFMASRYWVPTPKTAYQPFESDDEEEERRADEYEEAYNFRFEDPTKSNEKLRTHARDMAAKQSVRRDDKTVRKRKRDAEKEQQSLEKQQRREEKARLKNLRIDQIAQKVVQIKEAAGITLSDLQPEDWANLVNDDWDGDKWEEEMQKRFGDDYYAEQEHVPAEKGSKVKKPKFADDIDITDIVPDFKADDDVSLDLTDEEVPKVKSHKKKKEDKKREAKKERRIIEQLVDDQLQFELNDTLPGSSKAAGFRYRETSPQSFGLTSRDILLADDSQLNQFAGLKKLASFRDPEKKNKDKKHLSKKARLRKWRDETFGDTAGLEEKELIPAAGPIGGDIEVGDDQDVPSAGKKKRRRSKKSKRSE